MDLTFRGEKEIMKMDRQEKWIAVLFAIMMALAAINIDKFMVIQ